MERVHIQQLRSLPPPVYGQMRQAQRQAAGVWNRCCEQHQAARTAALRWPGRNALQKATKGNRFDPHSQLVQMIVHAFLANVDTAGQLRASGHRKIRYPYKAKRFYPVHWPKQATAVYTSTIVLPMGRG